MGRDELCLRKLEHGRKRERVVSSETKKSSEALSVGQSGPGYKFGSSS